MALPKFPVSVAPGVTPALSYTARTVPPRSTTAMAIVSTLTEVAAAWTRLATSVALNGATTGGGGSCLMAEGDPPQPRRRMASVAASVSARKMPIAITLRRWLKARLDSTGLRTMCSIGSASEFMVLTVKDKLRGLYRCCFEVVTPKCSERVLPDIHWAFGKRLPEGRIFD